MAEVRLFSYLPNPRVWKAVIAARIGGVELEVRSAAGAELVDWLWDFDARPLSEVSAEERAAAERVGRVGFKGRKLYKTDDFLVAHPFGTVPAGFSGDGQVGIFESNSIMRAVARQAERGGLYGHGPFEASRIDSFLVIRPSCRNSAPISRSSQPSVESAVGHESMHNDGLRQRNPK